MDWPCATGSLSHTLIGALTGLAAAPTIAELLTIRTRRREADTPDED